MFIYFSLLLHFAPFFENGSSTESSKLKSGGWSFLKLLSFEMFLVPKAPFLKILVIFRRNWNEILGVETLMENWNFPKKILNKPPESSRKRGFRRSIFSQALDISAFFMLSTRYLAFLD